MGLGISGDFVTLKTGSTPVNVAGVQRWKSQGKVERLSKQTASHGGFSAPAAGTRSVVISAHLVIDITSGSLTSIKEGTTITDFKAYAHIDATSPIYALPEALVLSCSAGGEMNGKFECDIEVENVGSFTFNNPSATA